MIRIKKHLQDLKEMAIGKNDMIFTPPSKLEMRKIFDKDIFQPLKPLIKYLINNKKDFRYISGYSIDVIYLNKIGSIECRTNSMYLQLVEFKGTKNSERFYITYENLVNIIKKRYNELNYDTSKTKEN